MHRIVRVAWLLVACVLVCASRPCAAIQNCTMLEATTACGVAYDPTNGDTCTLNRVLDRRVSPVARAVVGSEVCRCGGGVDANLSAHMDALWTRPCHNRANVAIPCTAQQTIALCPAASAQVATLEAPERTIRLTSINNATQLPETHEFRTNAAGYDERMCSVYAYRTSGSRVSWSCPGERTLRNCTAAEAKAWCDAGRDTPIFDQTPPEPRCIAECDSTGVATDCRLWGVCSSNIACSAEQTSALCSGRSVHASNGCRALRRQTLRGVESTLVPDPERACDCVAGFSGATCSRPTEGLTDERLFALCGAGAASGRILPDGGLQCECDRGFVPLAAVASTDVVVTHSGIQQSRTRHATTSLPCGARVRACTFAETRHFGGRLAIACTVACPVDVRNRSDALVPDVPVQHDCTLMAATCRSDAPVSGEGAPSPILAHYLEGAVVQRPCEFDRTWPGDMVRFAGSSDTFASAPAALVSAQQESWGDPVAVGVPDASLEPRPLIPLHTTESAAAARYDADYRAALQTLPELLNFVTLQDTLPPLAYEGIECICSTVEVRTANNQLGATFTATCRVSATNFLNARAMRCGCNVAVVCPDVAGEVNVAVGTLVRPGSATPLCETSTPDDIDEVDAPCEGNACALQAVRTVIARDWSVVPPVNGTACTYRRERRACTTSARCDCVSASVKGACSTDLTCGVGTRSTRTYEVVSAINGGTPCDESIVNNVTMTESCVSVLGYCASACVEGPWTPWSTCSGACGAGQRVRVRNYTLVPVLPAFARPCATTIEREPCLPAECELPPLNATAARVLCGDFVGYTRSVVRDPCAQEPRTETAPCFSQPCPATSPSELCPGGICPPPPPLDTTTVRQRCTCDLTTVAYVTSETYRVAEQRVQDCQIIGRSNDGFAIPVSASVRGLYCTQHGAVLARNITSETSEVGRSSLTIATATCQNNLAGAEPYVCPPCAGRTIQCSAGDAVVSRYNVTDNGPHAYCDQTARGRNATSLSTLCGRSAPYDTTQTVACGSTEVGVRATSGAMYRNNLTRLATFTTPVTLVREVVGRTASTAYQAPFGLGTYTVFYDIVSERVANLTTNSTIEATTCSTSRDERNCYNTATCTLTPVDCVQQPWSVWSACGALVPFEQFRTRAITTYPANGGRPCLATSDTRPCGSVNCTWSVWSADVAHPCQVSCGTGTAWERRVITQEARGSGAPCVGDPARGVDCTTGTCPDGCSMGAWGSWSSCSVGCGLPSTTQGVYTRVRASLTQHVAEHVCVCAAGRANSTHACGSPAVGTTGVNSAYRECTSSERSRLGSTFANADAPGLECLVFTPGCANVSSPSYNTTACAPRYWGEPFRAATPVRVALRGADLTTVCGPLAVSGNTTCTWAAATLTETVAAPVCTGPLDGAQCSCTADAQQGPYWPCARRYDVRTCASTDVTRLCGVDGIACNKRCFGDTCDVAHACTCANEVAMSPAFRTANAIDPLTQREYHGLASTPQPFTRCNERVPTSMNEARRECGPFALAQETACPQGGACLAGCRCVPGATYDPRAPNGSLPCAVFIEPCRASDVRTYCAASDVGCSILRLPTQQVAFVPGSCRALEDPYVPCTTRAQFTRACGYGAIACVWDRRIDAPAPSALRQCTCDTDSYWDSGLGVCMPVTPRLEPCSTDPLNPFYYASLCPYNGVRATDCRLRVFATTSRSATSLIPDLPSCTGCRPTNATVASASILIDMWTFQQSGSSTPPESLRLSSLERAQGGPGVTRSVSPECRCPSLATAAAASTETTASVLDDLYDTWVSTLGQLVRWISSSDTVYQRTPRCVTEFGASTALQQLLLGTCPADAQNVVCSGRGLCGFNATALAAVQNLTFNVNSTGAGVYPPAHTATVATWVHAPLPVSTLDCLKRGVVRGAFNRSTCPGGIANRTSQCGSDIPYSEFLLAASTLPRPTSPSRRLPDYIDEIMGVTPFNGWEYHPPSSGLREVALELDMTELLAGRVDMDALRTLLMSHLEDDPAYLAIQNANRVVLGRGVHPNARVEVNDSSWVTYRPLEYLASYPGGNVLNPKHGNLFALDTDMYPAWTPYQYWKAPNGVDPTDYVTTSNDVFLVNSPPDPPGFAGYHQEWRTRGKFPVRVPRVEALKYTTPTGNVVTARLPILVCTTNRVYRNYLGTGTYYTTPVYLHAPLYKLMQNYSMRHDKVLKYSAPTNIASFASDNTFIDTHGYYDFPVGWEFEPPRHAPSTPPFQTCRLNDGSLFGCNNSFVDPWPDAVVSNTWIFNIMYGYDLPGTEFYNFWRRYGTYFFAKPDRCFVLGQTSYRSRSPCAARTNGTQCTCAPDFSGAACENRRTSSTTETPALYRASEFSGNDCTTVGAVCTLSPGWTAGVGCMHGTMDFRTGACVCEPGWALTTPGVSYADRLSLEELFALEERTHGNTIGRVCALPLLDCPLVRFTPPGGNFPCSPVTAVEQVGTRRTPASIVRDSYDLGFDACGCECPDGTAGLYCTACPADEHGIVCGGRGVCTGDPRAEAVRCDCFAGANGQYYGDTCQYTLTLNSSTCVSNGGEVVVSAACERVNSEIYSLMPLQRAACAGEDFWTCECGRTPNTCGDLQRDRYGPQCEYSLCPTVNGLPCGGHGCCVQDNATLTFACICDTPSAVAGTPFYGGPDCGTDLRAVCAPPGETGVCNIDGISREAVLLSRAVCVEVFNATRGTFEFTCKCPQRTGREPRGGPYCRDPLCKMPPHLADAQPCFSRRCEPNSDGLTGTCVCSRSQLGGTSQAGVRVGAYCEYEVTDQCGVLLPGNLVRTCGLEASRGTCDCADFSNATTCACDCAPGYDGPKCLSSACPVACGPFGTCDGTTGSCVCTPGTVYVNDPVTGACTATSCPDASHPSESGFGCVCDDPTKSWGSNCRVNSCPLDALGNRCGPRHISDTLYVVSSCDSSDTRQCDTSLKACNVNTGTCVCSTGYRTNTTTNMCDRACDPRGTSAVTVGSLAAGNAGKTVCVCAPGWTGATCSTRVCDSPLLPTSDGRCVCPTGTEGANCELPVCVNGGSRATPTASACTCAIGWKGVTCAQSVCADPLARWQTDLQRCNCSRGLSGALCDIAQCTGSRILSPTSNECVCASGYSGPDCRRQSCQRGAQGSDGQCACFFGYTGVACEISVCGNGRPSMADGSCICDAVYTRDTSIAAAPCTVAVSPPGGVVVVVPPGTDDCPVGRSGVADAFGQAGVCDAPGTDGGTAGTPETPEPPATVVDDGGGGGLSTLGTVGVAMGSSAFAFVLAVAWYVKTSSASAAAAAARPG